MLVDNPDIPPPGGGEPAIISIGAMIANAMHDAIGDRFFELPMTPDRIMKVMAKT